MTTLSLPRMTVLTKLRFDNDSLREAILEARYDQGPRVPTYCEFDGQRRREVALECGISFVDTYRYLNDEGLSLDYALYVAGRFTRNAWIPDTMWRLWSPKCRRYVSQSLRGRLTKLSPFCDSVAEVPYLEINPWGDPVARLAPTPPPSPTALLLSMSEQIGYRPV